MQNKQTKWHADFFVGGLLAATAITLLFNGFSYVTSLIITNGEIIDGPTKQKGIIAFVSLLEESLWKYPISIFIAGISLLELKKGYSKYVMQKQKFSDSTMNMYRKSVLEGTRHLSKRGFEIVDFVDKGMHKYAIISDKKISFSFTYDRGYIVCNTLLKNNKIADLVDLANFKYYNNDTYKNLSANDITQDKDAIEHYAKIIEKEFDFLTEFTLNSPQDRLDEFEKWTIGKSTEYWVKVFQNKGQPTPESLKSRIKNNAT